MPGHNFQVTILGTGTSQGVPVIGCTCAVCQSTDQRDQRLRVSIMLSRDNQHVVVDAGPDFRQQMLRARPAYVDAILLTHEHNDHIIGLDDVRPYNFMRRQDMPIYCHRRVAHQLKQRFAYVFAENPYPGAPMFRLHDITKDATFAAAGFTFTPIEYLHGHLPVLGFRTGGFTYLTDIKQISALELDKVRGTDTLIISALHHNVHHSHANLDEALSLVEEIAPRRAYLTHMSHRMGKHIDVEPGLPEGVFLAYDGLELDCQ